MGTDADVHGQLYKERIKYRKCEVVLVCPPGNFQWTSKICGSSSQKKFRASLDTKTHKHRGEEQALGSCALSPENRIDSAEESGGQSQETFTTQAGTVSRKKWGWFRTKI